MTCHDSTTGPFNAPGSIRLLDEPLRTGVERAVREYGRRGWTVTEARDMTEFACHPCAILSDGSFDVFAKYSEDGEGRDQFENELAGLEYLSRNAGVLIPAPVGVVSVEGGTLLVMEGLKAVERGPHQWRQIGEALARIHRVKSDLHGFPADGYVGPLHLDNTQAGDWATFYAERRLRPWLETAIDSGHLPVNEASKVERVIGRVPDLCGPEQGPMLLHGDAQQNNFISTERGTYVIDPAVYYGNPEIDLSMIDCFQPVPRDALDAYREEAPIDSGFCDRRDLWRIAIYLAAVAIEGPMHLVRLRDALQQYV